MSHCFTARLAAVVLLAATAAPAIAAQATDIEQTAVSTHGLDLASTAGQQELRHRLLLASRKICIRATGGIFAPGYESCVETAFHTASVNAEPLIASARNQNQLAAK